jgi:formate dehydrogenase maturation protein FdhE
VCARTSATHATPITYLKGIDLTKIGLAIPIVDELATISLDLWAR